MKRDPGEPREKKMREEDKGLLDRAKEALTGEEREGKEEPPTRRPWLKLDLSLAPYPLGVAGRGHTCDTL